MTDRTSLKLNDERKRLFEQASQIVAGDPTDNPPRSDVIDAALTHLIESHQNMENARKSIHRKRSKTARIHRCSAPLPNLY